MKKIGFLLSSAVLCFAATDEELCLVENVWKTQIMSYITKGESENNPNAHNWTVCTDKNGKFVKYGSTIASCENSGLKYNFQSFYMKDSDLVYPRKVEQGRNYISTITLRKVMELQSQNIYFAVGMYQMIPSTLRGAVDNVVKIPKYADIKDRLFNTETQRIIMGGMFLDPALRTTKNYLLCNSDNLEGAAAEMATQWGVSKKPTNGSDCEGVYEGNGIDGCHTPYVKVLEGLKSSKNKLIDNNCANCQKEDENATTPENSNSSPQFDYTHTDKTFQSSKRQLKAQYKYENANNCYCNSR